MSAEKTRELIHVLMAEDSPTDAELAQFALEDAKVEIDLKIVEDGVDAMKYLHKEEPYQNAQIPDLILLDLNMPRMSGQEVLNKVRTDPNLNRIPIVILTTSDAQEDIDAAYDNHANAYVTKPVDFEQLVEIVHQIENFWFQIVKLPTKP